MGVDLGEVMGVAGLPRKGSGTSARPSPSRSDTPLSRREKLATEDIGVAEDRDVISRRLHPLASINKNATQWTTASEKDVEVMDRESQSLPLFSVVRTVQEEASLGTGAVAADSTSWRSPRCLIKFAIISTWKTRRAEEEEGRQRGRRRVQKKTSWGGTLTFSATFPMFSSHLSVRLTPWKSRGFFSPVCAPSPPAVAWP